MIKPEQYQGKQVYSHLLLLLIISAISHFPFVLNGFGEIDATKIAVSVIDMIKHGQDAAFANFYFSDVIPLYILYLKWAMKVLDHNYSYLPLVMNYTNAVFGTFIIVPAYLLIARLFKNPLAAFCTVLALIFAPSFYQSTIMGFPHLLSLFFMLISLNIYLSAIDRDQPSPMYILMLLSSVFLTVAFLFKSDIVLISGCYTGILIMRRSVTRGKVTGSFLIILISGLLFLFFRNLILDTGSGTTMSSEGLSNWYKYSISIPTTFGYFKAQAKPIIYGPGVLSFCLGSISFIYYVVKKRADILIFFISWAAVPTIFWLLMIGNNARHNMFSLLPLLAMAVLFFSEKAPRFLILLTAIMISGNFFITSPSYSILAPSGNIFKSNKLLEDRMNIFHERAEEIARMDADKVAVLGTFHNPHVIFELMTSSPSYTAIKNGRENYKLLIGKKEFSFIYFVVIDPASMVKDIDYILSKYPLREHVFVSAMYDLSPLRKSGLDVKEIEIIKRSSL